MRRTLVAVPAALLLLAGCASSGGNGPPDRDGAIEAIGSQLPARPYSQVVRAGDVYYFAGKVGATPETRAMAGGRTAAETRNVMESFRELLSELGLDFSNVVQATVYLAHIADYDEMNEAYGAYFPTAPPARETVAVKDIVGGAFVEISLVAVAR